MRRKEYTEKLEQMLLYTFSKIENSKNPEANIKWFVSEEAREWYKNHISKLPITEETDNNTPPYVQIAEELNTGWITKTFEDRTFD